MNEYQILYDVKNKIEGEIRKNNLFKLPKERAFLIVFEKFGVLNRIACACNGEEGRQEFLKKRIKTNATSIDYVKWVQESIKWIIRWCILYCNDEGDGNVKILAEDILELMGIAYCYEQFYEMWFLHSRHNANYKMYGNKIEFNYNCEDVYKIHAGYNVLLNNIKNADEYNQVLLSKIRHQDNLYKMVEDVHLFDFDCGNDFNFGDFNLQEYKWFSNAINDIVTKKMFTPDIHIIIPGIEGIICKSIDEWTRQLSEITAFDETKVRSMIDYFTYNQRDKNADISLTFFLPYKENFLILCEGIYFLQRPEKNAIRVFAKTQDKKFQQAQNNFEDIQKQEIVKRINKKYYYAINDEKEKKIRPGLDFLVYDRDRNHLQVVELKYKIPIESVQDRIQLDVRLNEGYDQLNKARAYIEDNKKTILSEYFGEEFLGVSPQEIDYFVLTNDSIGTGNRRRLPTPILNAMHYTSLMERDDGMFWVQKSLQDEQKNVIKHISKRNVRFTFCGYKILIPEYQVGYKI